jgi:hypothetical protein
MIDDQVPKNSASASPASRAMKLLNCSQDGKQIFNWNKARYNFYNVQFLVNTHHATGIYNLDKSQLSSSSNVMVDVR